MRWWWFFSSWKGLFRFFFNKSIIPAKESTLAIACLTYLESLCISSQQEIFGNIFNASYEVSKFCWQIAPCSPQHLRPCHIKKIFVSSVRSPNSNPDLLVTHPPQEMDGEAIFFMGRGGAGRGKAKSLWGMAGPPPLPTVRGGAGKGSKSARLGGAGAGRGIYCVYWLKSYAAAKEISICIALSEVNLLNNHNFDRNHN